MVSEQS